MQNYELLYIVSNQYTEDELTGIKNKVNAMIAKNGGVIGYEEFLGKKKLAYPIKKALHGYYQVAEFELEDGETLKVINNELRLDKEVLRAQIITKHKITPEEIKRKKDREAREEQLDGEKMPVEKSEKKKSTDDTKVKTKNLDEKLDEILKDDIV